MTNYKQGGIKEMVAVALPMVVSFSCDTAMTFTDRAFLATLAPELMNAAMGGGLTAFMTMTFFMGVIGFSTSLTAQYYGAGQKGLCPLVTTQAFLFALAAFPLIILLRPLAYFLFQIMQVPSTQLGPQVAYFDILIWGSLFALWRHTLSTFFSGVGQTRPVMMASAITMATNVAANYVLIFGALGAPELGIRGAAYGTVIGSLAGVLSLLCFFFSEKNKADYQVTSAFKFHWRIMGRLLRFGYPNGIELFFNLLAFNSMVLLFHSRGPVIATASTIMFNWDMVSFVPLLGVEIGVISLVGRYVGAKQPNIAEQATISGLKLGLIYSAFVFVLFVCFPECLVSVFSPRNPSLIFDQAVPTAVNMIRLASLYVMFEAVVITYTGALRGAGDTFWAMCISTSSHWTLVALLFLLLHVLDTSAETAWMWMVIAFLPLSCLVYLRYRTGHWREIQVIDTTPEAKEIAGEAFHEASPS